MRDGALKFLIITRDQAGKSTAAIIELFLIGWLLGTKKKKRKLMEVFILEMATVGTLVQQVRNIPSMQRSFDSNYYENRCRMMNETIGKLDDGYNCERCRNKGFVYTTAEDGELLSNECSDCFNVRTSLRLLKSSGLEDKTFENFIVKADWQSGLLRTVKEFAADTSGK